MSVNSANAASTTSPSALATLLQLHIHVLGCHDPIDCCITGSSTVGVALIRLSHVMKFNVMPFMVLQCR